MNKINSVLETLYNDKKEFYTTEDFQTKSVQSVSALIKQSQPNHSQVPKYDPLTPCKIVPASLAINWIDGNEGDIWPRLFEANSELIDSGSLCTVTPADDSDTLDTSTLLRAVNGDAIQTYGKKIITVKIGRKPYRIEAIKAKIPETILGWDFIKKHHFNFIWGNFDDVYLVDNRNGIKTPLQYNQSLTNLF